MAKNKPKYTEHGLELPEGITIKQLKDNYDEALAAYGPAFKRMRIIDATYRGRLWKAINAKLPSYQVITDTNHVSYVASNLLASLYSVGRSAELTAKTDQDLETVTHLNLVLEDIWDTLQIPYYQMLAGERAAVTNIGITQVGWNEDVQAGRDNTLVKGMPTYDNIDPMQFMRDPYAKDLDSAAYTITFDTYHKEVIKRMDEYKEPFKDYLMRSPSAGTSDKPQKMGDQNHRTNKDRYDIVRHWVFNDGKLHEIHTIDNEYVIYVAEDIRPRKHPFAIVYCNLPAGDIIGSSEPSKIFANSVAYNIMNSLVLTREVKNQNPPRYVNTQSQINLREFMKHGNDTDQVFQVQGDATKAVHYHEFPNVSPSVNTILGTLGFDIQSVTGIDGKYTGGDMGSVITTGGMEQLLDQATMVDAPKIVNYEKYTRELTTLTLANLIEHGAKRKHLIKNPRTRKHQIITVDYKDLQDPSVRYDIFGYKVSISPYLPKNKQRIAQMANVIMEKQMQYNQSGGERINLITPEEWLMMQDLPMKEYMLERMGIERSQTYVDTVTKTLFEYSRLVDAGLDPSDALMETANSIEQDAPSTIPEEMMQGQPPMPPMPPQAGPSAPPQEDDIDLF